ncbi:MAG: gamma-glutamyl-gamma-aminobutyrate hydrolase family protein [Chloroflexi bacterium]|nr:gamma-glutamyl-gamma-aminobutyrate hydrolase family protein [Chloroflexota bacterium]
MRSIEENFSQEIKRPVIGITGDVMETSTGARHSVRDSYVSAIINAGGIPLFIPSTGDLEIAYALYRMVDGLLFTGGVDIDPAVYGEPVAGTEMDDVSEARDTTEVQLARWAFSDDLPVLGICRGQQLVNVAAGGTLYQDIPSDLPDNGVDHRGSTYTNDRGLYTHRVDIEPSCGLAGIFGETEFLVNSLHHQGVKQVGEGLKVVGTAPDGMVEALEGPGHRWLYTVQWHPEELWRKQSAASNLFKGFVEAAAQHFAQREAAAVAV